MNLNNRDALTDWLAFALARIKLAGLAVRKEDRLSALKDVACAREYLEKVTSELNKMPATKPV
jgi:hypothetical protein